MKLMFTALNVSLMMDSWLMLFRFTMILVDSHSHSPSHKPGGHLFGWLEVPSLPSLKPTLLWKSPCSIEHNYIFIYRYIVPGSKLRILGINSSHL